MEKLISMVFVRAESKTVRFLRSCGQRLHLRRWNRQSDWEDDLAALYKFYL